MALSSKTTKSQYPNQLLIYLKLYIRPNLLLFRRCYKNKNKTKQSKTNRLKLGFFGVRSKKLMFTNVFELKRTCKNTIKQKCQYATVNNISIKSFSLFSMRDQFSYFLKCCHDGSRYVHSSLLHKNYSKYDVQKRQHHLLVLAAYRILAIASSADQTWALALASPREEDP